MSVKIRLKRMGSKRRPFYRIVVADSSAPRDGRFITSLGTYNPLTTPKEVKFDEDAVMGCKRVHNLLILFVTCFKRLVL